MRTNRKRVAVPFLFRAADGLGASGKLVARAYGNEVEGVFTRAGAAVSRDGDGRMIAAPHSIFRLATVGGEAALLLESVSTNLSPLSEDFSSWAVTGVTTTANTVAGPFFTTTGDTLTAASAGAVAVISLVTAFAGDGIKGCSVFLKAGTAATTDVSIFDSTATATRHRIRVTWTAGVAAAATNTGTGSVYAVESYVGGWYRITFSAAGCVAANNNRIQVYPDTTAGTGTVYAWGGMAEDTYPPTSYIATAGSAVARVADSLYFPFPPVPQEMTVYARGIEKVDASVTLVATTVLWSVTDAAGTDAKMYVRRPGTASGYRFVHEPDAVTETASVGASALYGDVVEFRAVLASTGAPLLGVSRNAGTEDVSAVGTAQALASAWSAARLYLNSFGSSNTGAFAFTHLCVALGTKTRAEMRVLAEV